LVENVEDCVKSILVIDMILLKLFLTFLPFLVMLLLNGLDLNLILFVLLQRFQLNLSQVNPTLKRDRWMLQIMDDHVHEELAGLELELKLLQLFILSFNLKNEILVLILHRS
jgi:hypothetical protein